MRTRTAAIAVMLSVLAGTVRAQDDKKEPAPLGARPIISFEFDGGSLTEFVATIRAAVKAQLKDPAVNIVMDRSADLVSLPPIALRRASIDVALQAAQEIAHESADVHVKSLRQRFGEPVWVLRVRFRNKAKPRPQHTKPEVSVLSIRNLTEDVTGGDRIVKAATVLTAIEAALEIAGGEHKATVRYHEDSGLLLVASFDRNHLMLVQNVVERIRGDLDSQRALLNSRRRSPTGMMREPSGMVGPGNKKKR